MGVNTDGEETNPETSLRDDNQTTESWQMEHETEHAWSTNNFLFDVECTRGIQDPKLMGATDTSLITPQENMSSKHTSVVSITEQTTPQQDNTDGGNIVLSNNSYRQKEMLNSTPASFTTNSSKADDMCTQLKECRLQTSDITKVLDNDSINALEDWDTAYKTLLGEISSSDVSGLTHDLPLNPDIDKLDNEGYTPLYKATLEGDLKAIDDLISQGANLDKPSKGGVRPFHVAAQVGHADIVDILILHYADPSVKCDMGQTPLHTAAANGHTSIIDCVIAEGVDVNEEDNTGWTPFNASIERGHLESVKFIINKGAKQNRYDGMTPLYAATKYGHLDIVEFLVSSGAKVNEEGYRGRIPLHQAAISGNIKMMEYLIQQGSDVNKADRKGWTTFNAAVQYGHQEAVKFIIDKGAKQNRYDEMTPLYAAAKFGHLDIAEFLVSNGANVNEESNRGRIPLHKAAVSGNIKMMEYLIQQGSDVNKADRKGWTTFNAAIQYGHQEAVKYLIDKGAKQNRYDGMTPLYAAAKFGHLDIAKSLVSNGANVNEESNRGRIPLHKAAVNGNIKMMEYLIQQGSDVNKADRKGRTTFNAAIQYGHQEAVEYLIDKGAKQNRYDGMTPLYAAAKFGHLDIAEFLVSNGANVNEESNRGRIPLHQAAVSGNIRMMEYLIQQGSDVNKAGCNGWTPINAAIQFGHVEAVKYLMDKGANQNRYYGATPLYFAAQFGHIDIVQFLISNGSYVNEEDDEGMIALHAAAREGNIEIVEFLIQHGSDVSKAGNNGLTPLNAAIIKGHSEVVKFLIAKGANYSSYEGMTPLYIGTQYHHIEVVRFLLSKGYSVNEGTESGKSPLHAACYNGNIDMVEYLLLHNADVNHQDQDGWTPLQAAAQEGHQDIIKFLSVRGANMKDIDGITSIQASPNIDHSTRIKGISSTDDVCAEIATGDPQYKNHQNAITAEDVTASTADPQAQSCSTHTEQSKLQVHNIHDENAFIHAEIEEENCDEHSFKDISTGTHHHEDEANGTRTPFFGAQLKSPDKPEHDPTQNHMEAIDDIMIRKQYNPTNNTGFPNSIRPQTWQYSGYDPQFLQTQNNSKTSGKISDDPKSRWHRLTEEIEQSRKPPNDLVIHGAASESNRTQRSEPSLIGHQNVYYRKQLSNIEAIFAYTRWKIFSRHRSGWTGRPPSLLQILQTFIQMLLALAILLSGCPIHVAGSGPTEVVTLTAGSRGVVQFHVPSSFNDTFQGDPYYVFRFESQDRPFCINGEPDAEGFKNQSQLSRFTTNVVDLDTSPCVNLIIDNVETVDQDGYIFKVIFFHSLENVQYETVKKNIVVQIPHGPAKCFITVSEEDGDKFQYEVHCRASSGSAETSLSCFQNGQKLHSRNGISDDSQVTRGIFFLPFNTHFACCSHEVSSIVSAATCNDFEWPRRKLYADTTARIASTLPKSVNTTSESPLNIITSTTTQMKYFADSAARRPFIHPFLLYLSLWSYLSMQALNVVYYKT